MWLLSPLVDGLVEQVAGTGSRFIAPQDPLAELVHIQRLAASLAHARAMNADRPAFLARAVILEGQA